MTSCKGGLSQIADNEHAIMGTFIKKDLFLKYIKGNTVPSPQIDMDDKDLLAHVNNCQECICTHIFKVNHNTNIRGISDFSPNQYLSKRNSALNKANKAIKQNDVSSNVYKHHFLHNCH